MIKPKVHVLSIGIMLSISMCIDARLAPPVATKFSAISQELFFTILEKYAPSLLSLKNEKGRSVFYKLDGTPKKVYVSESKDLIQVGPSSLPHSYYEKVIDALNTFEAIEYDQALQQAFSDGWSTVDKFEQIPHTIRKVDKGQQIHNMNMQPGVQNLSYFEHATQFMGQHYKEIGTVAGVLVFIAASYAVYQSGVFAGWNETDQTLEKSEHGTDVSTDTDTIQHHNLGVQHKASVEIQTDPLQSDNSTSSWQDNVYAYGTSIFSYPKTVAASLFSVLGYMLYANQESSPEYIEVLCRDEMSDMDEIADITDIPSVPKEDERIAVKRSISFEVDDEEELSSEELEARAVEELLHVLSNFNLMHQ